MLLLQTSYAFLAHSPVHIKTMWLGCYSAVLRLNSLLCLQKTQAVTTETSIDQRLAFSKACFSAIELVVTAAFKEKPVLMPTIWTMLAKSNNAKHPQHKSSFADRIQGTLQRFSLHVSLKLIACQHSYFPVSDTLERLRESKMSQFSVASEFPILKLETPHQH